MKIKCSHPVVLLNPYFEKLYRSSEYISTPERLIPVVKNRYFVPYSEFGPRKLGVTVHNYTDYFFVDSDSVVTPLYILVPCGKCLLCRNKKTSEWAFRAICESRYSETTPLFITLTYSTENLPSDGIMKEEVQKWFKRLRSRLDYYGIKHEIRYFACGEYGSKFGRPHYHAILWNFPRLTNMVEVVHTIQDSWGKGFVKVCRVTKGGINYVMKYMRKIPVFPPRYKNPPFFLSSRKNGGLGYQYCLEIKPFLLKNPDVSKLTVFDPFTKTSMTLGIPRYFKDKIFSTESKLVPIEIRRAYIRANYFYRLLEYHTSGTQFVESDYYKEFESLKEDFEYVRSRFCFLPVADHRCYDLGFPKLLPKHVDNTRYYMMRLKASLCNLLIYDVETSIILERLAITESHRNFMASLPDQDYNVDVLTEKVERDMLNSIEKEIF
ncbi:hypothetical protein [Coprobacter secundus]|uniref:rolling circle replication-associated protein n=1 Tax=Coprobacter secundus TaxID=1501392 RepID=UPI0022E7C7C7|nr:hypothetical protein [Coprobacter secundus]